MTRHGKRLLQAAYEAARAQGEKTLTSIAKAIGCSHPHVRTLLYNEDKLAAATAPTWSSVHLEALCHELKVPLWMVVSGLRPDQRKVIEALERVREFTPDRYQAFVNSIVEQADDRAARGGWEAEETTGSVRRLHRPTGHRRGTDPD